MRKSQCQVCGEMVSWRSLFGAKETTGVKAACINCIEKAARVEGAKAMQKRCLEVAKVRWVALAHTIPAAIAAIDPATVGGGG